MSKIHADSTMADLLSVYPGAQRALFRKYHIGGCSSCGFHSGEKLSELCARNENIPVDEMIAYLKLSQKEDDTMMISPKELFAALKEGDVRILDIRTKEEFEAVQLPGAIHFNQEMVQEIMADWQKDELFVILDHEGQRSMDAAAYFAGHGFTGVKSLRGGIDAWSVEVDQSLPRYTLESAEPPQGAEHEHAAQ